MSEDGVMLGKAAAGLTALGLIGGAGTVIYDSSGDATVKIADPKIGTAQTVTIKGDGSKTFECPDGTQSKLDSTNIRAGRIKLTEQPVRRAMAKIERQYPSHRAPGPVADRYNALFDRDHLLVSAYNAEIREHNAILERECSLR
jgi:hypothetical protein